MTEDKKGEWQSIDTAPKDGSALWVSDPDCGAFLMAWDAAATNEVFAPGKTGLWVMLDRSTTWNPHDGYEPTRWAPGDQPMPDGWHVPAPPVESRP